jgi:tetratricopeptide (TPR) repeat protein
LQADLGIGLISACWTKAVADHLETALDLCNEALPVAPQYSSYTLDSRGFIYFKQGQLEQAVADFNAVLKQDPKKAASLYLRGLAQLKLGNADGAADIKAAELIQPDIAAEYARYGIKPLPARAARQ